MTSDNLKDIFTADAVKRLFPDDRADQFFDALLGDAMEGAYDILLEFKEHTANELRFEFHLKRRPEKCLVCSLTYGLPEVFSRHRIININGLVEDIDKLIDGHAKCTDWQLGATREVSADLHTIPFTVFLDK